MQLNAGSFFEPAWEERRSEIVAWIDEVAPDVVCLQEIWRSSTVATTASWLAERAVGDWHLAFGGMPMSRRRTTDTTVEFGPAVLSRWPFDEEELHILPLGPGGGNRSAKSWGVLRVRTAALDVFSVHLAAAPHETDLRQAQVVALDQLITTVRNETVTDEHGERRPGMPVIVGGDFNAEPDSDEIRFLCGLTALGERTTFYQDAWRVAGDGGPGLTQDWRHNPLAADLNVHRKRIDYVFVGDAFRRVGDGGRILTTSLVCNQSRTGGMLASDHFGVVADIVWPTRPA